MSSLKEVHLFDAPEYSSDWTPAEIDERYRPHFAQLPFYTVRTGETVLGEATPVYCFLPYVAPELKRYNPELKLIVLLREPVERAISHYYMERNRGGEHRPLWLALLLERFRLRWDRAPRPLESPTRRYSYRARGLYSRQLRNLYRSFDPDRVLVLRAEDLLNRQDDTLRRAFVFLGVSREVRIARRWCSGASEATARIVWCPRYCASPTSPSSPACACSGETSVAPGRAARQTTGCSAPKPVRRFAAAARRRRLRPSHADRPWNNHRRSLRSRRRMFHERVAAGGFALSLARDTPTLSRGSSCLARDGTLLRLAWPRC